MTAQKKNAAPVAAGRGVVEEIHDQALHQYHPKVTEGKGLGLYRWYEFKAKQNLKRKVAALPYANRIAIFRLPQLERLFAHRYACLKPVTLPDDDSGRDDLTLMLCVAVFTGSDARKRMDGLAVRWAPWLHKEEADALIARIRSMPRWFTPDELAWRLKITLSEREGLKLTTMGCIELPNKKARDQYRRNKDNAKRREKRRQKPKKVTVAELAKAEGMSRATYYRKYGPRTKWRETKNAVTKR